MKNNIAILFFAFFLFISNSFVKAQELNTTIFSVLNLEFKGLEKVKSLHEAGKEKEAAAELLDYYRNRNGIIVPGVNLNKITISENEQKWADQALEHKLYAHEGYPDLYYYGKEIDWNYWPVQDNEYRLQFHRQMWFAPMGKAYKLSGDEKYAKEWTLQYVDWIKHNPVPTRTNNSKIIIGTGNENFPDRNDMNRFFAWRALGAATRLQNQGEYFEYFKNSKFFSPEFLTVFLTNIKAHADYLVYDNTDHGNPLLFECQRLLYSSAIFPEFKDSQFWKKLTIDILVKELDKQFYPDGMHTELDPRYHAAIIDIYAKVLKIADLNGFRNEIPAKCLNAIEKMIVVNYNMIYPDYSNPMFSDAKRLTKSGIKNSFKDWSVLFPDNNELAYFATEGKKGNLPEYNSRAFLNSGFYIFRNGWKEDATVMMLKAGPPATNLFHCQPDNGTFELYVNGRNFFPDAGSYVYAGEGEVKKWRDWFQQTAVHNTLTLNDSNLQKTDSKCLLWKIDSPTEILVTENPGYKNLKHRRSVFFVEKKFFVIVDEAVGSATGRVGVHFQMCEGAVNLDFKGQKAFTQFEDGNNILLKTFSNQKETMEEREGWVSYEYLKKNKRKAFVYNVDKKNETPTRFITVILPLKDAQNAPEIKAKFDADNFNEKQLDVSVEIGKMKYSLGYKL
jgi:heparan-sulfate lyase